jgi:hypothetical protein
VTTELCDTRGSSLKAEAALAVSKRPGNTATNAKRRTRQVRLAGECSPENIVALR